MTHREPAQRATRRSRLRRARVAGLLVVIAAVAAAIGYQSPASSTSGAGGRPAVTKLDPELLAAVRRAAASAARDGVGLHVDSGWRSPAHQRRLLREAIAKYGSEEEAARWVATPRTSAHVKGEAVDIGPPAAAAWLSVHGAGYGLCRIYGNEPWHYELRPQAVSHGCPPAFADPTQDPRMQR